MESEKEKRFHELSLIVVDEDHGYGTILVQELRSIGVNNVVRATSPKDALHSLGGRPVDVIITEWYPGFVAFLRDPDKSPKSQIPILVVTDQLHANAILAARDAGVDEIMAKPVSSGVLAAHIHDAVDDRRPFIEADAFHGPDRRRHKSDDFDGPERRGGAAPAG
jgi:two-component system, chemotaxis family, chemotaxis protein CheY